MSMENKKLVHTLEMPVRWCDMDAFGHVNNSVFLSYFESARISWWGQIVHPEQSFQTQGPVIINANCTFLKTIMYPETLLIKLYVGPAGRSSHECYYEIFSKSNPEILYAQGSTKVVWVDRRHNKSIPLPDFIRNQLPADIPNAKSS